ncbi:MAG: signal recognition particle protein [Armatimonadota bacterium]|nr:signal recognition particle protein [Armatimonadota bacterium]
MFDNLTEKLTGIFGRMRRRGRISEADFDDAMREVRIALLEADVSLKIVKEFISHVREKAVGEQVWDSLRPDEMVIKLVRDELVELLGDEPPKFAWSPSPPTVVLLCGLQGSGKTTTAAKLALRLQKMGKKPMLAACDLQRPAAIRQLQVLGEAIGVPVFADTTTKDPVRVAKSAIAECKHRLLDTLILDTAGRLQIDEPLMKEIRDVSAATMPTETLLVVDSTTGQEAVAVAESFDQSLGITGLIFTKLDGDTRGGAVLSVRAVTGKPVRFVGVGEATDALDVFDSKRIAERILGFGDVLGLIERVQDTFDEEDAKQIDQQFRAGKVDFETLLSQMQMVKKMGNLKSLLKLIPGMSQLPKEVLDEVGQGGHIERVSAVIHSMTPSERRNPDILNGSRKRRIAAGSGTSVEEVNRLIKSLDQMQKQMKQMSKMARDQKQKAGRRKMRRR